MQSLMEFFAEGARLQKQAQSARSPAPAQKGGVVAKTVSCQPRRRSQYFSSSHAFDEWQRANDK
jgi:hypothetical protein